MKKRLRTDWRIDMTIIFLAMFKHLSTKTHIVYWMRKKVKSTALSTNFFLFSFKCFIYISYTLYMIVYQKQLCLPGFFLFSCYSLIYILYNYIFSLHFIYLKLYINCLPDTALPTMFFFFYFLLFYSYLIFFSYD